MKFLFFLLMTFFIEFQAQAWVATRMRRPARLAVQALSFSGSQSLATWNCSSALTVSVTSPVSSDLTVNLSGSNMIFYSDSSCGFEITSTTITTGSSSANVYFTMSTAGTLAATASATNYTSATVNHTSSANPFTWTGAVADNNWATPGNWLGMAVPGNSDLAVFDASCGVNCNVSLTSTLTVGGVRMASNYTGQMTQSSGVVLTIGNKGWTQKAGTFNGSNANIFSQGNFVLDGGTFNAPSTYFNHTESFYQWKVTSGTFNAGTGTVLFSNCNFAVTPGATQFRNVELTALCNFQVSDLVGIMNVNGDLTIAFANYVGSFGGPAGEVRLKGNLINDSNSLFWGLRSTLRLNGDAASNVIVSGAGGLIASDLIIASAGTITFTGTNTLVGGFSYSSGIVNFGTSKFVFSPRTDFYGVIDGGILTFYDVEFANEAYGYLDITGTLNVSRNVEYKTADGRTVVDNGTIALGGNLIISGTPNWGHSTALVFNGTGSQTVTVGSGQSMPSGNFTVNKASGTLTLASNVELNAGGQNTIVTSGSVNMAGFELNVRSLSLNGRTLTKNSGILTVNGSVAGTGSLFGGTVAP